MPCHVLNLLQCNDVGPQDLADATAAGLGNSANADLLSLLRNRITPVSRCFDNPFLHEML